MKAHLILRMGQRPEICARVLLWDLSSQLCQKRMSFQTYSATIQYETVQFYIFTYSWVCGQKHCTEPGTPLQVDEVLSGIHCSSKASLWTFCFLKRSNYISIGSTINLSENRKVLDVSAQLSFLIALGRLTFRYVVKYKLYF